LKKQFREFVTRFMIGRYGTDKLGKFLMGIALVCIVLSMFIRNPLVNIVAVLVLCLSYIRMFSRNIESRFEENQKYERVLFRITEIFRKWRFRLQQARQYHIYKCPKCGQKIRVPRGKGKISIHCPKCNTDFVKKS
jgi:uncharacterized paraquat-inducible protein A